MKSCSFIVQMEEKEEKHLFHYNWDCPLLKACVMLELNFPFLFFESSFQCFFISSKTVYLNCVGSPCLNIKIVFQVHQKIKISFQKSPSNYTTRQQMSSKYTKRTKSSFQLYNKTKNVFQVHHKTKSSF